MGMEVIEDRVDELLDILDTLNSSKIIIGVLGDSGSYEDISVVEVASIQEFGATIKVTDKMRGYLATQGIFLKKSTTTINIPERSFIRAGFDANKQKFMQLENELAKVLTFELDVDVFMNTAGEFCVGLLQEYLTDLSSPPNSPMTIMLKKSSNPLIDTGKLRSSIDFRIEKG